MRKGWLAFIALMVVLGVGSYATMGHVLTAQAARASTFHVRGQMAEAGFSRTNGSNIVTSVTIFADNSTARNPLEHYSNRPEVLVEVVIYDTTMNRYLMDASNDWTTPVPLQFGNQLNSATLGTVVATAYDWISESMFTITFNAAWTATGSLSRDVSSFHHREPGLIINGHSNGTYRPATATGNISVVSPGGTVVVAFNGVTADWADLRSSKSGEVDIIHK